MTIAKPVRALMSALLAGGTAGVVGALSSRAHAFSAIAAMLAFVPAWLVWSFAIDRLDLWLRK